MILILGAIALILVLGAVAFFLVEQWEKGDKRKLVGELLLIVAAIVGPLVLRVQLTRWMDCLPHDCPGANLVGRDLQQENLSGGNFVQADLSRANLQSAQLSNALLSAARLNSANLQRADLTGAMLYGADLTGADLTGATLAGADLRGANLKRANLSGIDLSGALLLGAQFEDARLIAADLTGAQLKAVTFAGAQMNGANLGRADMSGAVFSGANLSGARMADSSLSGALLNLAVMIGADLTSSDLSGASLIGANLASANLNDSNLMGSTLVGVDLDGASVYAADLRSMRIDFASLTAEDWLRDARLSELNEDARNQIERNTTQLQAASSDSRTIWDGSEAAAEATEIQQEALLSASAATDALKIGLLLKPESALTLTQEYILDAMLMAVDEINLNGGVLGRQLLPVERSVNSDPDLYARTVRELIEEENVAVIFSAATSEQRKAALPVLAETDTPLFYFARSEGFETAPQVFYVGGEPSQYVAPAVQYLVDQAVGSVLLIGRDDVYARTVNAIVKAQLQDNDVALAGELFVSDSAPDFRTLLLQIQTAAPAAIISTFNDDLAPEFYDQFNAAGLTSESMPVLNLAISEDSLRLAGPDALAGHMLSGAYFQSIENPEDFAFGMSFQAAYGEERVTSEPIASAYGAVFLWLAVVEAAQSVQAPDMRAALAADPVEQQTPRGVLHIDGATQHSTATARVGVVQPGGVVEVVYESETSLPPDPYLAQFAWATGLADELNKQAGKAPTTNED